MLNGGTANGVRFLSPKTVQLMTANHLPGGRRWPSSTSMFSEVGYAGVGFARLLGHHRCGGLDAAGLERRLRSGRRGLDLFLDRPQGRADLVFLTQLLPSDTYPVRRELRTLVYSAFEDTNA